MDPQEEIIGITKAQQRAIDYAKKFTQKPGQIWLPTDLIGKRVEVKWGSKGAKGFYAGTIIGYTEKGSSFEIKYDVPDAKSGESVYSEHLLGARPPTWRFEVDQNEPLEEEENEPAAEENSQNAESAGPELKRASQKTTRGRGKPRQRRR